MNDVLSDWLSSYRNSAFDVVVAGRHAGGLLEQALHRPACIRGDEETLTIDFQGGERLTVSQPMGIQRTVEGDLIVAQGTEATFSWQPRTNPDDPEAEYLEVYRVIRQGYAILTMLVDRSLVGGPVDPDPTTVALGGKGVPFVRLTRIAGA